MLPKIKKTLPLEESLVLEDHLNDLTYGFRNQNYRKLKIKHMPKPIDTPFGNFPKEYCTKSMIKEEPRHQSIFTKEKEEFPTSKKRMASEPSLFKKPFLKLPKIQSSLPKCGAFLPREITFSEFRRIYDRGEFPFKIDYQGSVKKLIWKQDINLVDYHYYLPILFDGLREKSDPYRYYAIAGTFELIEKGANKIPPVIPQLILPLKTNLNTRDQEVVRINLIALQKLVLCNKVVGQILVPYFRQLLPMMNLFKNKNANIGDQFDYSQRKNQNLGDIIDETLEILESNGGENAYINIKYMIPTYESCIFG